MGPYDPSQELRAAAIASAKERGMYTGETHAPEAVASDPMYTSQYEPTPSLLGPDGEVIPDPEQQLFAEQAPAQPQGPGPGPGPALQLGMAADQYDNGAIGLMNQYGAKVPVTQNNRHFEHRQQFVGTVRGALDRQAASQDVMDESGKQVASIGVQAADELANAEEQLLARREARDLEHQETARAGIDRASRHLTLAEKGAERMMSAPAIDPDRWWASRTQAQRVNTWVQMFGRGLMGLDPMDIPNRAIDRDIDAQKSSFGQIGAATEAAQNNTNLARGLYADIRAQVGDEREADEVYRLAKLTTLKSQFEAVAARAALPGVQAQIDNARAQLDQAMAKTRENIETFATNNVRKRTVMVTPKRAVQVVVGTEPAKLSNGTPNPRAGQPIYQTAYVPIGEESDKAMAKHLGAAGTAARGAALDIAKGTALEGAKAAAAGGGGPSASSLTRLSTADVKAARDGIKEADRYIAKYGAGTPGVTDEAHILGWAPNLGGATDASAEAIADMTRLKLPIMKGLFGTQMSKIELTMGAPMFPTQSDTGKRRLERIKGLRQQMVDRLKAAERLAGPEAAAQARGMGPGATYTPGPDLSGIESWGTPEDDAEALEGTPR